MNNWKYHVEIKHLMTEEEDWLSIQDSMISIADVLDSELCFVGFDTCDFRCIPNTEDIDDPDFSHLDYANDLLNDMYDYADAHRIWIE